MLQGRMCCSTPERVFGNGGAPSLPRGEIPVHFDAGPLKRRKSLNFAPGKHSSKGRIFTPGGGMRLAGSAGEAHGEPLVPRTPCVAQRPVCPRRASSCPNMASAGSVRLQNRLIFAASYKDCPACKVSFQTDAYLSQPHFASGIFLRPASALPLAALCRLFSQVLSAFIVTHVRVPVFGSG